MISTFHLLQMGGYNCTYSPALRQAKFYLLRQPSASGVRELWLSESTRVPESTREGAGMFLGKII